MKKLALTFAILMVTITIFVLVKVNTKCVVAGVAGDADYTIERVNHTIEVMYNGYVLINDTIKLNVTEQAPSYFLIGFPYEYGSYVLRCIAYNESDFFPVSLDVPLEDRVGFYGVKISFPHGTPQVFTAVFVLSNDLIAHSVTEYYNLNFPSFPSLTKPTAICNVSITFPEGAIYFGGTVGAFVYSEENLPPFTYNASEVIASLADDKIILVDVQELHSEIRINELGNIEGADTYRIKNKAQMDASFFEVILPPNASNPSAQDQFGRRMAELESTNKDTNRYKITFTLPLKTGESTQLTVKYDMPRDYIFQEETNRFAVNISLFQYLNYYINEVSVSSVLPEGARIVSSPIGDAYSLMRGVFQEAVTINRHGVISLDSFNVEIVYEYSPLWLSFRPTLWIWALATLGCAVVVVWKRPKAPIMVAVPKVAERLRPEYIRSFTSAYEEKRKIGLEIESLETRVRKGRIPRRRYKVQRKTLETRLSTLSKSLAEMEEKMLAAGGKYADLTRQLEIAETEINEVESSIRSIEARHSRGELSLEAYRRLLADYERRKGKAETTIKGILLRFREEIR